MNSAYFTEHPCKQTEFNKLYQYSKPQKQALRKRIVKPGRCQPGKTIVSLFPVFLWLPKYDWKGNIVSDIVSGFTVAIMHIPQGMAYALLGGVPPIIGMYMAFFPVLLYVLMGTSRHVSMGTFAVVCMMASKSVLTYSVNEPPAPAVQFMNFTELNNTDPAVVPANINSTGYTPVQVATAVCFVVGVWQVILGVCRLGVLSVLLSDTLVSGFTTGAAVHVLTSQVKNLLGVKVPQHRGPLKVIYTYIDIFKNIGQSNPVAIGISAVSIGVLSLYNEVIKPQIGKKLPVPLPVELMAVIAGTLVSMYCNLSANYKITVVGEVPTGLPEPVAPPFALIPNLLVDGLVIAIVAFSVNMSMASIFARKLNYSVDANQELLASGASNILGSFFSCLPFSASLSRSLIQQTVGGKTQLASVVSCLLLLLVLLLIGPFFEPLPNSVLASIVVVALKGMFMQLKDLPMAWRQSPFDGMIWLTTFLAVVLLDIDYGLGLGVALSLICVLIMGQRPKVCRLGQVPNTQIYLDINRYQAASEIPGIRIIQVAGGLHFANKDHVRRKVNRVIGDMSEKTTVDSIVKKSKAYEKEEITRKTNADTAALMLENNQIFCVILDMMSVCFVDPSAVKTLVAMYKDFKSRGLIFCLADCSATVHERMLHCDFFEDFPDSQLFPSVHDAVLFAQQSPKS
ncbi:prestin-like isoform X2 [Zootermopsis nevadensis]|uniref:Prestin n=3 Tax=Zootermopsis nevadensis TaxID=136037 RepID=A0A067RFV7_ZOONE|nr:prestin-like isoform X2 [Zootermopsis nevadensis]KDR19089.1 Prestin [Zootermopsis nevadensis]